MRYRTIAEVCDGIGINRQQFNKYLSGAALPNTLTLDRICRFLNISHASLFAPSEAEFETVTHSQQKETSLFDFLAPRDRDFDFEVKSMPAGNYLLYTPILGVPGVLLRSALIIRVQGNQKRFFRVSKLSKPNRSIPISASGRHTGLVFSNGMDIYLLGRNRYSPRQLSLLVFEKSNELNDRYRSGLVVTKSLSGTAVLKCVAILREPDSMRELLKKAGSVHESEVADDHLIVSVLSK